ncbi:SNF2-related protein [Thalassoroseus pseudoceratinae]|uniref:SNF2-related protein n=1 Tax=Thalassoroseus pseudoceratinae TaxID=2713176 RepID=UPI0014214632|nr:SNF2-related protein [Thalassoroseus pseudoceratinae]
MTLSELLEGKFRADLRFRGAAYLEAERVSLVRVTPEQVFGVVRDSGEENQTQLSRVEGDLKMYCTCDAFQRSGACKHLWATVLCVEQGNLLTGPARPGNCPPFVAELEPDLFEDDWDEEEDDGDVFQPPAAPRTNGTKTTQSTAVETKPRLRPWESRLQDLRKDMRSSEPPAPSAGREREIFYEIDIEESRNVGQLVVQTSQRQRRANGQWGKLKPLKLRPGKLDEVEHEDDSKILAYLTGGTPERSNWYAQQAEVQSTTFRYRIPFALCELILPLMCRTGRVRFMNSEESEQTPLSWDEGSPWDLTLHVSHDGDEGEWSVDGLLRRDDESIELSETELLVPGGLVLTNTHIARLQDFDAFNWVNLFNGDSRLTAPEGEEHDLVDQLLDMPTLPRLDLPKELDLEEITCDPVPYLTIRSPRGKRWHWERLQGDVRFDYLGTQVSASSTQWAIVQREQGRCILRNREAEETAWTQLQENGFRRLLDQRRSGFDVEIAARSLGPAVRTMIEQGWIIKADGQEVRQPGKVQFRVESGIDWFELHAKVDFGGGSVSFPELLSALSRGDTTIRLDDGSWGILPEEWQRQFGLLSGLGIPEDEHVRFSHNQVALLDALLGSQELVERDEQFEELRTRFREFGGVQEDKEPTGFKGELRGYQREGLGWLSFLQDFRLGGCLADDMGLGKTIQVLALLMRRRQNRDKRLPSLIVVPKSLLFNWHQESTRFTPEQAVLDYSGLDREALREKFDEYDIILTTYGTLRRDIVNLKDVQFDYVILDEAQTIKNPSSQIAKASRLLRANHRVALSGTPIENHLGDLWSIFEFLNPGMLGRSSIFKSYTTDTKDENSRQLLTSGLRPFILRRTKSQVAGELPEKVEQTLYCDMGTDQRRLYDELRDHYRSSLLGMVEKQGLGKSKMHVLEALLRLRQAACHPGLLREDSKAEQGAKLEVLVPHLEELIQEGHKSLVFSQFTSMLSIVRDHLDEAGLKYEYLDGQTRDRAERVESFQNDPEKGIFLISLKAGGLGLNLTAADYVFLLDPWWNPAVEAQAIDRAHRVGQTRQVFAYRLICRGTVEEKIAELQKKKRGLAEAILEADNNLLRDLSTDDLELLLS